MKILRVAVALLCLFSVAGFAHGQSITLLLNSQTVEGVADGSPLTTWTGEVGSATSSVGSLTAPTFVTSSNIGPAIPAVRFNATSGASGNGMISSLTQNSGAYTVMTLYNHNDTSDGGGNLRRVVQGSNGTVGGGPNWLIGPYGEDHRHFANPWVTNPGPSANTGPALATAINTGIGSGTSSFFVNGTDETDSSAPNGGFGTLGLGVAGRFTEPADSDVGLILVFDDVLSEDQRTGVEFIVAEAFGLGGFPEPTEEQFAAGNELLMGTSLFVQEIPEPASVAIWSLLGAAALGLFWRRKRRQI